MRTIIPASAIVLCLALAVASAAVLSTIETSGTADNVSLELPHGYTMERYSVAETTNTPCETSADCELPFEYAIRSNCPYQAMCLKHTCTIVCPEPES